MSGEHEYIKLFWSTTQSTRSATLPKLVNTARYVRVRDSADTVERRAMDPLAGLLALPLTQLSASELHSRITLLEDATRACHAELQRRPSQCQEPPPSQPAAASSSCILLQLSHDEVGVVAHELCDPLRPLLAVNLSSTAKVLRVPMQAELVQLRQQRREAEAFAALTGLSITQLRDANNLELGSGHDKPLTLTHWRALGTLIGCGSLPMLEELEVQGSDGAGGGIAALAAGLRRGGLPSLCYLRLSSSQIGDQAASALASALTKRAVPTLTALFLDGNQIGDPGLLALGRALRQLPTLRDISLFSNQIGDQGLAALIAQPMTGVFESLESLDISDSHVTDAGCAILAAALRGGALPTLERVDVRVCGNEAQTQSASTFTQAHKDLFAARGGLGPI